MPRSRHELRRLRLEASNAAAEERRLARRRDLLRVQIGSVKCGLSPDLEELRRLEVDYWLLFRRWESAWSEVARLGGELRQAERDAAA